MSKSVFWTQLSVFMAILVTILLTREYVALQLVKRGIGNYSAHMLLGIAANVILIVFSFYLIGKNNLETLAGLANKKLEKGFLLIFPLVYLVLLNVFLMDDLPTDNLLVNLLLLAIYAISIGFAEELSIRGFLQSHFIRFFGTTTKRLRLSVFLSALLFGIIHFIKFDKGIYGELSQVCFALFIGVMFGFLLLITKRIYPLIILHAIVDFVAKLDSMGISVKGETTQSVSAENAIAIVILVSPCLIYGIFLMKRYPILTPAQTAQS